MDLACRCKKAGDGCRDAQLVHYRSISRVVVAWETREVLETQWNEKESGGPVTEVHAGLPKLLSSLVRRPMEC